MAASLAFCLLTSPVAAQSLSQMLYDVYDNSPDIRAEEAAQEGRRADLDTARAAMIPSLSATGSHKIGEEKSKEGASRRTRTTQYGMTASHRVFNGFQDRNKMIQSRYQYEAGQYALRGRETEVLLSAVRAYMDVYSARKMIALRRRHVDNLLKQRRATKARIKAGELTRTDLSRTDALLSRARASLSGAQADLGAAAGQFEALAGYKPAKVFYPQIPERFLARSVKAAEQKAISMHPQLRAARATNRAMDYNVKAAEGTIMPSLDVNAGITKSITSVGQTTTPKQEKTLSLRLSLPIFDGGVRVAGIKKARAERSQARHKSSSLALKIRAQARERYLRYDSSKAMVKQARAEVKAAKDVLRGIKIEEKAGQRSFLDVLDAEVALLDAREVDIYAKADSVIAIYSYLASTGQLTVTGARKAPRYAQVDHMPTAAIAKSKMARKQQKRRAGKATNAKDPWSGLR
ncbi:MAG: TolC family protein [Cohaesibacter sp.]|nr:TolC family protein [Cohaesibacter sp.]